jgi:hypothetical protein
MAEDRMGWYRHDDVHVSPQGLIDFAWSAPMRDLAAKIGISDVGLKKLLKGHGIVTPPQGHWNRVHAGRPVPSPPQPRARRPGETGRLRVDKRFKEYLPLAPEIPVGGPFASAAVPEDLGELHARELKAIGRVAVPKSLDRHHPGLARLLRREDDIRAKLADKSWYWDSPAFDGPLAQRQLRLLNGLFFTLAGRDHSGDASNDNGNLVGHVRIGDMSLTLEFSVVGKHRTERVAGYQCPARDLPASTPLQLAIRWPLGLGVPSAWQDDARGTVEKRLAEIAADIIVAGEAAFRRSLVEAAERREIARLEAIEARRRELERLQAKRVEHLVKSGDMLASADRIRTLISRVEAGVSDGRANVSRDDFAAWRDWASAYADSLDPLLSGQIFDHIRPPSLSD